MGACATKPADLKVKGEAPVVLEDAAEKKAAGVAEAEPAAGVAEAEPVADGDRRRSLSDLLKENDESDVEAPEAERKAEEPAEATADENGATEEQLAVQPSMAATTAEILEPEAVQDPQTHAQVVEEEKRVDPDSVQVAVVVSAQSVEDSKVVADACAQSVEESKVVADASA
ncbi:hypothetical protein D1007_01187 [Hordeum vulgare]|uniref:Uncharacterized protein n=1 Tax=Hordeum vulgare subsp. vulgare TaxID=112509 RepID=A0A8I7B915_HORVV|nr:cytochrome c1-like [Hordeum vulgare subsp. vulgare]KAE8820870.1 hypothetical protein D1007_01187 [Hordeum vulgare]